ncbi:uncharacterized protein LOC115625486 [Scaptodrosophila lebanonensis]|uniref:Regulatory protein zeste n=1 Tax=Drosophila lebanonensis TaxID=7225 RepID=A0A6J2TLK9_DROLE|nr:uncharacterized protein LOC115625486 [Scaptodrosophila lebanonensis]
MGKHRSPQQNVIFIEFMEKHSNIARGHTNRNRAAAAAAWESLTAQLNENGPPCKTVEEWRRVWKDWKQSIRNKIAKNKRESSATCGGHYNHVPLTAAENAIAVLLNMYDVVDEIDEAQAEDDENEQSSSTELETTQYKRNASCMDDSEMRFYSHDSSPEAPTKKRKIDFRHSRKSAAKREALATEKILALRAIAKEFHNLKKAHKSSTKTIVGLMKKQNVLLEKLVQQNSRRE